MRGMQMHGNYLFFIPLIVAFPLRKKGQNPFSSGCQVAIFCGEATIVSALSRGKSPVDA